ncbi:uncharacterized protein LOC108221551 [Daucus carota subsp. sativus]|uniref:uncharacterized protein LOC108221551 n=1 Tax=Daucus carota subsp. sativus TaxID=79200 RepID=UPI0007EFB040|nr:PREDICTED: uncharacterized protein LOC108221551 [Daucus carota subsp. sativus]
MKAMPCTTVKIQTEPAENGVDGRRFKRFYVCLGPLKAGFLSGCRPLLGLDGCHLKGPYHGILLTAVATDPNEGMYPVAWAQVEAENNSSWEWFLSILKDDLHIENDEIYTFICDRQKGLVNALETQFPAAEKRFCVMHLYQNLCKESRSLGVRREMWGAAKSTTDYFFNMHMENNKKVNMNAFKWLAEKPKSQWSRCGFRDICKSDVFVNNNCEIFNNAINPFRGMGIITMFKSIHTACMQRIEKRKSKMEARNTVFCTKALKKLDKAMRLATKARPVWNGGDKFQVTMSAGGHEIVVDLKKRECACRKWQLTVEARESDPTMLKRKGTSLRCGICQEYGHNSRTCKKKQKADNLDKEMEEVLGFVGEEEVGGLDNSKRAPRCNYCKEVGHNTKTCTAKQLDERNKKKEKVVESQGSQTTHQMDNTSNPTVNSSIKGTTHGGTARPFKPPAKVGPLGVEASSVGKKKTFTSLRNLEKAAVIRKNGLGKKD